MEFELKPDRLHSLHYAAPYSLVEMMSELDLEGPHLEEEGILVKILEQMLGMAME